MFKFKNRKSKKELVAHSKKSNGDIAFNPGSQTGAKPSDYMFNDIAINIPGTNFQITTKPNEELSLNVSENSIMYYNLDAISKDYGNAIANISDMYATLYDTSSGNYNIKCDKTWEQISTYEGKVIPRVYSWEYREFLGELNFVNKHDIIYYSSLDFPHATLGSHRMSRFTDDIIFGFDIKIPEYEYETTVGYSYNRKNIIGIPYITLGRNNCHLMTYDNGEFNIELVIDKSKPNDNIITLDKSAVNYFVDLLKDKFNRYNPDFFGLSHFCVDINKFGARLGQYCVLGGGVFSVIPQYNSDDGLYHISVMRNFILSKDTYSNEGLGAGLYAIYKDENDGLTEIDIDVTLSKDENGIFHYVGYTDNIPESIEAEQTYDVSFNADIDITWGETATIEINGTDTPIVSNSKVAKLNVDNITIHNIDDVTVFERIAESIEVTNDIDLGEYGTVKAGSVMYVFPLAIQFIVINERECCYDFVVYSDESEWKTALIRRSNFVD